MDYSLLQVYFWVLFDHQSYRREREQNTGDGERSSYQYKVESYSYQDLKKYAMKKYRAEILTLVKYNDTAIEKTMT